MASPMAAGGVWCMVKYTNSQLHQYALNLYDWQRKWRCNMGNSSYFHNVYRSYTCFSTLFCWRGFESVYWLHQRMRWRWPLLLQNTREFCANNCFAHFALGMFHIIWHTIMVRLMKTLAFPSAHLVYRPSTKGNNKFTIIFNKKTICVVCIRN